jgi:hypothetical protein
MENKKDNVLSMFFAEEETVETNGHVETFPETKETVEEEPTVIETVNADTQEEVETESTVEEKIVDDLVATSEGQFSLFGDDAFVSGAKKEDEAEESCGDEDSTPAPKSSGKKSSSKKKSTTTSASTSGTLAAPTKKPVKDQNLEVSDEFTIHYATHTFRVTDFINPMPASGKVTLDELRQKMEEEFYEMTKERTKWDYDETLKRLYPDVSGTSKGVSLWV